MDLRMRTGSLELRHLRYFLAIAEEMNFGQAAEKLNIAQPGLSQQIKILEQLVGVRLFDRSRRQLRMTPAGEAFLPEIRKVMQQVDRAVKSAQQAGRGETGQLAIGYLGSAAYTGALTRLVGAFRDSHPQVRLAITENAMMQQLQAIAEGSLDLGFIRPPVPLPEGLAAVTVLQEELMMVLPAQHPLAELPRIHIGGLSDATFITPQHASSVSFGAHTLALAQAAGFEPRLGPQGRDFMTIVSMVSVGLGVALVPQSVQCIQLPNVVYRPIAGAAPKAELALAYRRNDGSAAVRHFIAMVRKLAREAPDQGGAFASG